MTTPRDDLRSLRAPSYGWGLGFLLFDASVYGVALYGAVTADELWKQLIWSVVAGFCTAGLLIVAHDACHQSLTPNRLLNRIIGTLAFLPALHAYSLWRHGHNFLHHLHTNQRGKDYVWEPLSLREYQQLSAWQKWKYRFYRSFVGHYFYYPCEIWVRRRFVPRRMHVGTITAEHWLDSLAVIAWMLLLSCLLIAVHAHHKGVAVNDMTLWAEPLLLGIGIPFFLNGMLNSDSTYLHHTHPAIHWSWDKPQEGWDLHQTRTSIHVRYPQPIDWFLHWIMDHTAHHLQPAIPLYRLKDAQQQLEQQHGEQIVSYRFTFAAMRDILKACKLYDDQQGCWTDFEGRPTSAARHQNTSAESLTPRPDDRQDDPLDTAAVCSSTGGASS
jgi:omega-6 fatty acid desaturase (delta-12 desaturase)